MQDLSDQYHVVVMGGTLSGTATATLGTWLRREGQEGCRSWSAAPSLQMPSAELTAAPTATA